MYSKIFNLHRVNLAIHDGDGGAAAAGDGGEGADNGGAAIPPEIAGRVSGEKKPDVMYGKQDTPAAGELQGKQTAENQPTAQTPEEKKAKFRELVGKEYKNEFNEFFQETFDKRFKGHKSIEERMESLSPLIETLGAKYGISDPTSDVTALVAAVENDATLIAELADESGLSPEQYKQMKKLERDNSRLLQERRQQDAIKQAMERREDWFRQSEEMKGVYPQFDLEAEMSCNPEFFDMLVKGVPVKAAYQAIHFDDIVTGVVSTVGKRAEATVTKNIRAKGMRPSESGTAAPAGVIVKDDPSKLTRDDMKAIAERARRGEIIKF